VHGLFRNAARVEGGVQRQRLRRRQRVRASRSNRHDPIVRLDEIAVAGQEVGRLPVHYDEHGLQTAQDAIGTPILRELDGRALEIAAILLQFGLEPREEGERIGGRPGKAGQDPLVVEPPDLARALLDDGVAEGDLAVAGHDRLAVVADGQDRGCVKHS
jgi:hypothetical protein